MSEIRCVLFDYGNVISQPQTLHARQEQAALAGLDDPTFDRIWGQYRTSYDQGVIDGRTYWSRLMAHGRTRPNAERLKQLIEVDKASWRPSEDWILGWAEKLRDEGIRTGVLSNMPPELAEDLRSQSWINGWEPIYFSSELRLIKPFDPIYRHVCATVGCNSGNVLFMDDRADNVRGAIRAGLNAVRHTSRESTLSAAAALGLPLP